MTTAKKYGHLGESEPALIEGYLLDVNPRLGTAKIHAYVNSRIPLRFDPSLEQEMLRLEKKFVKVRGRGWINDEDEWIAISVENITCPMDKSFDIDEFHNNPAPKIFDPDKAVRVREPFDVEKFLRDIYKARRRLDL